MPEKIHGKEYSTVPERLAIIQKSPDVKIQCSVRTEIVDMWTNVDSGLREVIMKATIVYPVDGVEHILEGHAHERELPFNPKKKAQEVNFTSYIENCETSAVGRALGNGGIGGTTAVASAEEMKYALNQQQAGQQSEKVEPEVEPESKPEKPQPPQSQDEMAERARLQARQEAGEAYGAVKDALDGMGLTGDVFNGAVYYHFQVGSADEMTLRNYRHLKDDLTDGFASWIHAASKNIGVEPEERIEVPTAEDKEEPAKTSLEERLEERHATTLDNPN